MSEEQSTKVRLKVQAALKSVGINKPHHLWLAIGGSKSTPGTLWNGTVDGIQFDTLERLLGIFKGSNAVLYENMVGHLKASNLFEVIEGMTNNSNETNGDSNRKLTHPEAPPTNNPVAGDALPTKVNRKSRVVPPTMVSTTDVTREFMASVSPTFVKIYSQAISAETNGLDEIAGIGLQKSLECLIKDFLIRQRPSDAEEIKVSTVNQCVTIYVDDINVKRCVAHTTWLANDEAQYVRRWEAKDIKNLKTLIRLTMNWIDSVLLAEDYLRDCES
jgi:hypothetical protein